MPQINKQLGIGAVVSILAKFLHPKPTVIEKIGNLDFTTRRMSNMLVCGGLQRKMKGKDVFCVELQHNEFKNIYIWAATTLVKVQTYDPASEYFKKTADPTVQQTQVQENVVI